MGYFDVSYLLSENAFFSQEKRYKVRVLNFCLWILPEVFDNASNPELLIVRASGHLMMRCWGVHEGMEN